MRRPPAVLLLVWTLAAVLPARGQYDQQSPGPDSGGDQGGPPPDGGAQEQQGPPPGEQEPPPADAGYSGKPMVNITVEPGQGVPAGSRAQAQISHAGKRGRRPARRGARSAKRGHKKKTAKASATPDPGAKKPGAEAGPPPPPPVPLTPVQPSNP